MSIKGFSVGGNVERYDYNFLDNRPSEITVDTALSGSSTNPVQNSAVTNAINAANVSISSVSRDVDDLKSAISNIQYTVSKFHVAENGSHSREDDVIDLNIKQGETFLVHIVNTGGRTFRYQLNYSDNTYTRSEWISTSPYENKILATKDIVSFSVEAPTAGGTSASDFVVYVVQQPFLDYFTDKLSTVSVIDNNYSDSFLLLKNWKNRIYYVGQGIFGDVSNRIGLQTTFITKKKQIVTAKSGYNIAVTSFSQENPTAAAETGTTGWVQSATIEPNTYYIMSCKATSEAAITANAFGINPYISISNYDSSSLTDYLVSGLTKERKYVNHIGTFPDGFQAFCKYNGDYYVIKEGNIYVIDGTTFAQKNTAALSFGHGNSMQLGHTNIAYISGWNDGNVYAVNLDTLTITNTYTLPAVSGETSIVAVDDVNMLMYIFKKTNPDSIGYYDFVIYNYDTEQIVSSKKITKPFAAMQSCQYVDGLIIAVSGLATEASPNGYRIYNTNGDIVQEYVLNSIHTEPEGVFFDDNTKELLISDINRKVYKIT